jgi:hypothetical protein
VALAGHGHECDEPSRSAENGWRIVAESRQIEDRPHDVVVVGVVVNTRHPKGIGRTRRGKGPQATEPENQKEDERSSPPHGRQRYPIDGLGGKGLLIEATDRARPTGVRRRTHDHRRPS